MPIHYSHFDIGFAGWGASTCLLLKEMEKHDLLSDYRVAIIDPSTKKENDKTNKRNETTKQKQTQ